MSTKSLKELENSITKVREKAVVTELLKAGFEKVAFDDLNVGDTVYSPMNEGFVVIDARADENGDFPLRDGDYLLAICYTDKAVYRKAAPSSPNNEPTIAPVKYPHNTVARVHFKGGVSVCFMNTRGAWFPIGGDYLGAKWNSPDVVAVHVLHNPVDNTKPTLTTLRDNPGRIAIGQYGQRWMYSEGDFWFWHEGDGVRVQSYRHRPDENELVGARWAGRNEVAPREKKYVTAPYRQVRIESMSE